jgi:hypothetical protein
LFRSVTARNFSFASCAILIPLGGIGTLQLPKRYTSF